MTHIRRLVSVLLLVWLSISSSASNAQDLVAGFTYNSINLVNNTFLPNETTSTWQNVGQYGGSLQCWAPGDPGYCGPLPYLNANGAGMINFSYGLADLYQIANVAAALPNTGTGISITGFTFGFRAKNGNGWDGGRQDYLKAYVELYKGSQLLESYDYSNLTNRQYNWTDFFFNETFNNPYTTKTLSTVRYGFVGQDTNYWAGPYGPEVYNVSFSLKFTVDPCATNQLSSPTCPGFASEMAKLNVQSPTTIAYEVSPTVSATITPEAITATVTSPTTQTTTTTAPASTTVSSNPETSSKTSGPSLNTILSIVRNEQSRIAGVESSAVQQANETASKLANTAKEQGESVAASLTATSVASSMNTVQGTGQTSIGFNITAPTIGLTLPGATQPGLQVQSIQQRQIITEKKTEENKFNQETEVIRTEAISFVGSNPINDYLEQKPVLDTQSSNTTREATVKKDAQDSEIAGGVTLSAMAKLPIGYDLYSVAIKDSNFYAPKDIYKNQRIVDNDRIQRMMNSRSDRVHQEMVDGQYRE